MEFAHYKMLDVIIIVIINNWTDDHLGKTHAALSPFIWRKVVQLKRSTSYPGGANSFYILLQNLMNRLHEKQKVGPLEE